MYQGGRVRLWVVAALLALGMARAGEAQMLPYESPGVTRDALPTFYEALKRDNLTYALAWRPEWPEPLWREVARAKLWELTLQRPDRTAFDPVVLATEDRGTYTAMKIVFSITKYSRVAALLLEPKSTGPFPAALVLHDHGAKFDIGKEKLVMPINDPARLASGQAWVQKYYGGNFIGDELAARGYVVLATDALGWGDRTATDFSGTYTTFYDMQQALASNMFNMGSSLTGLVALEDVRAAEFLASLPVVDRRRVASVGFSMGAFRSWQVAALTDVVRASVVVNWMATDQDLMEPGNNQLKGTSAFYQVHPGMFHWFDYADAASIAAPKPALFYAGQTDPLFPVAAAQAAFAKLSRVWAGAGASGALVTQVWDNPHVFTAAEQAAAFEWLDKTLAGLR
jgi:dienelactone hydrolase